MKTIKQLMRQPVKTAFGIILMTLAAAILCVCVGQALAARETVDEMERSFTTLALPSGSVTMDGIVRSTSVTLPDELLAWLEETAQSNPDVIKELARHGTLSAYIPELTALNLTESRHISDRFASETDGYYRFQPDPLGMPYTCAALTFTLEELGEPQEQTRAFTLEEPRSLSDFLTYEDYFAYYNAAQKTTVTTGYTVKIAGTVTGVVSLQKGYRDPTGMTLRVTLTVTAPEELAALELALGGEYIVYGMDYFDEDWALRGFLADERQKNPVEIEAFDPDRLRILTEEEVELYYQSDPYYRNRQIYAIYDSRLFLSQTEYEQVNSVSMTLGGSGRLLQYEDVRDEDGNLLEIKEVTERTVTTPEGETLTLSNEEYFERYQIPTIAKLDTTVQAFLDSEAGRFWRETLEWDAVNDQAFLILGVDKVGYLTDFARQKSRIVEGRDFTGEEISSGARVCVIHEQLAAASGLTVGDTISLNFYQMDESLPYQSSNVNTGRILNPSAYFYFPTTPFTEEAEYTIVGLWRGEELWDDVALNEYILSPNTVIVPISSVQTEMRFPISVPFTLPILHNGQIEAFKKLAVQAGHEDAFVYHDQGYSTIAESFHNYDELGEQVLMVGAMLYAVLLLLFLLLFPRSQRKAVQTMESLGEPFGKRFGHVVGHAAALLLPATALGGLIGAAAWQSVVNALAASAESTITLELEPLTLALIALAQCALALLLNMLAALSAAKSRGMAKRR